jgi:hypothetical protein
MRPRRGELVDRRSHAYAWRCVLWLGFGRRPTREREPLNDALNRRTPGDRESIAQFFRSAGSDGPRMIITPEVRWLVAHHGLRVLE